jgi:peptidoglycan/LPS O-acetylase OafA/YrhL
VEVAFYILAPVLACLFAISNRWGRRALIFLLILAWPNLVALCGLEEVASRLWILSYMPYFFTGFLLVEFYLSHWFVAAGKHFIWDVLFLLCGVGLVWSVSLGLSSTQSWSVQPWIFLLVCLAAFRGKTASWLMSRPWITTIGGMCYTIYMYHWLLISLLMKGTVHLLTGVYWLDLLLQFLVLTPVIILICAVPFVWFERPFMRKDWPARLRQFFRGTPAAVDTKIGGVIN